MLQAFEKFAADATAGREGKSYVFFLGRENFPKTFANNDYKLGKAQIVADTSAKFSKSVALVAGGSLLHEALVASDLLAAKGIGSIVVNPAIMNYPDVGLLMSVLAKTSGKIISIEDHQEIGGQGQMLTAALHKAGVRFSQRTLAVTGEFGQSAYNAIDLYRKHHLDSESMVKAACELIGS